jgi:hypothetical protein
MSIFRRRTATAETVPARPSSSVRVLIYNPDKGTRSHYLHPSSGGALCGASTSAGWAGRGGAYESAYAATLPLCGLCRDWGKP